MKKMINAVVTANEAISPGLFSMCLDAPHIAQTAQAGQFVMFYMDDGVHLLPRPLSVCDADRQSGLVRVVYQVVGEGTAALSRLEKGCVQRLMGPVGHGFSTCPRGKHIVVGGGIGIPPLLYLCRQIQIQCPNDELAVFLGFRSAPFLARDFEALGITPQIATDDGSHGFHGNVVALLEAQNVREGVLYACGPYVMLKSLAKFAGDRHMTCQVSMEERMACGLSACTGCVVKTADQTVQTGWVHKKVCDDGPVFSSEEVLWDA